MPSKRPALWRKANVGRSGWRLNDVPWHLYQLCKALAVGPQFRAKHREFAGAVAMSEAQMKGFDSRAIAVLRLQLGEVRAMTVTSAGLCIRLAMYFTPYFAKLPVSCCPGLSVNGFKK